MRIAICDDDELHRTLLIALIKQYMASHEDQPISYSAFSCAEELFSAVEDQNGFDLYILDIVMPEVNGIDIGIKLRRDGDDGLIIYLTSSRDYAIDSYDAKAFMYLLKPIIPHKLFSVLEDAYAIVSDKAEKSIIIKTKDNSIRLSFDNILYVELCKRIIIYHLANGDTVESIYLRVPFTEAMHPLLADGRFVPCGRTAIVNLHHITLIGSEDITFKDTYKAYFTKKVIRELRSQWTQCKVKG